MSLKSEIRIGLALRVCVTTPFKNNRNDDLRRVTGDTLRDGIRNMQDEIQDVMRRVRIGRRG